MFKANRNYLRPKFPLFTTLVLLVLAAVFVAWVQPIYAQVSGYATINGTVTDPTGAVVSDANVTITNTDTGAKRDTVTGSGGEYAEPYLPPGHYSVTVSHPGFKNNNTARYHLDHWSSRGCEHCACRRRGESKCRGVEQPSHARNHIGSSRRSRE